MENIRVMFDSNKYLNSKEFYIKAHVKLQFSSVVEGET